MKPKQLFLQYKFSFLCALAIIVLSLYPMQETPLKDVTLSDKWAHFLMYGGLAAIVFLEMQKNKQRRLSRTILHALIFPILLGILMEIAQATLTTYRSGDFLDALANTLGASAAFALCQTTSFLARRNKS